MAYDPGLTSTTILPPSTLEAGGHVLSMPVVIAQRAGTTDAMFVTGRLCHVDSLGKLHALADAETVVPIDATGEVLVNALGAVILIYDVTLATPPIPGTVTIATTLDASATPKFSIGPDNGQGYAESADGFFSIDYESGRARVVLAAVATAGDDLKAGYTHRIQDAVPADEAGRGLPKFILLENILGADVVAGDVKTTAYIKGRFRQPELLGYSAGYEDHLRSLGILIQPS